MASSNSVFATLRSITAAKQVELERNTVSFRNEKINLLESLEGVDEACERIRLLLAQSNSFKKVVENLESDDVFLSPNRENRQYYDKTSARRSKDQVVKDDIFKISGLEPKNLERLMNQSKYDTAITQQMLKDIEEKLRHSLDIMERKYEFANLFNKLVTERTMPKNSQPATPTSQNDSVLEDLETSSVKDTETLRNQTKVWEGYHLSPNPIDLSRLRESLEENFEDFPSNPEETEESLATAKLREVRKNVKAFCDSLQEPNQFDRHTMNWVVDGLIKTDLLSSEQVNTLREIAASDVNLAEMADLLNLKTTSIASWDWPGPVKLEMRKQLNGKYRAYMHEEIADALLIHYVGVKFCVNFKRELRSLSPTSKKMNSAPQVAKDRREFFLRKQNNFKRDCIRDQMNSTYWDQHFLSQFPKHEKEGSKGYGEDDLAKEADQTVEHGLAIKQALLHLIYTDAMVQNKLGRNVVLLQTDFKWFGPSLSHDGVFTILEFFGVTPTWIRFITKFLKAPLQFIHDDPDKPARIRERGYPMSHVLSTFVGEMTLFHLDYSVAKATGGGRLFRLHDDIFFWSDPQSCCKAWKAINLFCRDLGLELNMEKTGAARMVSKPKADYEPLPSELPEKGPRWGFVNLNPATGKLEIDRSHLEKHVPEFRRQLSATSSVFAWIQAYNAYVQYILNQLIAPCSSFGRIHVTDSLNFLREFHDRVFPEHNGDPASALKALIESRFSILASSIPTSFLYFPLYLGGLELRNPFVRLHALRAVIPEQPFALVDKAIADDNEAYKSAKETWEREGPPSDWTTSRQLRLGLLSKHEFLPYGDFIKYNYEFSPYIADVWDKLKDTPREEELSENTDVRSALARVPEKSEGITRDWDNMTNYWRVVSILYGHDMMKAFGGMEVVERKLLPMGMVGLWKGGKVRWEG